MGSSDDSLLAPGSFGPVYEAAARDARYSKVLFVSFFTRNTPYEEEIQSLIESLDRFQLGYFVAGIDGRGTWRENCLLKPVFIREAMHRFGDYEAIVWLDGDSVLKRSPVLFTELAGVDLAIRFRGEHRSRRAVWKALWRTPTAANLRELAATIGDTADYRDSHACVIYLANRAGARQLVDDWLAAIEEERDRTVCDQDALDRLLERNRCYKGRLRLYNLPPTYADKNESLGALPLPDAVIQQRQLSTELALHDSVHVRDDLPTHTDMKRKLGWLPKSSTPEAPEGPSSPR